MRVSLPRNNVETQEPSSDLIMLTSEGEIKTTTSPTFVKTEKTTGSKYRWKKGSKIAHLENCHCYYKTGRES